MVFGYWDLEGQFKGPVTNLNKWCALQRSHLHFCAGTVSSHFLTPARVGSSMSDCSSMFFFSVFKYIVRRAEILVCQLDFVAAL